MARASSSCRVEPRKLPIFLPATLKEALIGLLLAGTLTGREGWRRTLLAGAVLGGLVGLVVGLARALPPRLTLSTPV